MSIERRLEPWTPYALAALRIVAGYLFLMHGTAKLFGFPHVAMFDRLPVLSMLGVAGMLEVAGGALLIVGLFTRFVGFVLSGEMAFAYFLVHAPSGHVLLPILNDGEAAVLYCFHLPAPRRRRRRRVEHRCGEERGSDRARIADRAPRADVAAPALSRCA